jgi:RHS repeat-associated protein
MGCRQLTYQNELSHLKVAYRACSPCAKTKQGKQESITYDDYAPFLQITTRAKPKNFLKSRAGLKRYRYTGMERDEETGLSYHNARYYIPWLGRWLNPDPIGIGDGVNVYAYCGNNPTTYSDTSGTQMNKPFVTQQDNTKVTPRIDLKGLMEAGNKVAQAKEGAKLAKAFGDNYKANNPGFEAHAKEVMARQQKKAEAATRVEGALQVVGGAVEAVVGGVGGVVTSPTGAGAVAGGLVLAHGADNMAAGFNKLVTGQPSQTFTEKGISAVAQDYTDKATADKIGAFGNAALGIAGSSGNVVNMVDAAAINSVKPVIAAENAVQTGITVTEESIAKALEGSTMQTIQGKVSLPMVQRYVKMLESGSTAPAIKVADGVIIEGNHRYVAGRIFGKEPAVAPGALSPSDASKIVPIQQTKVDLNDWGGY